MIIAPSLCRLRRMLTRVDIICRPGATMLLALIVSIPCSMSSRTAAEPINPGDSLRLPDAADVVDAYFTVRGWVDSYRLPGTDEPASRVSVDGATGVFVSLRRHGRVVGSAAVARNPHIDDALLVRRAAGRAMAQAIGDSMIANLPSSVQEDVGRGLTLELDIAGELDPLLGRTFARIAQQLEPGLDGVAMRRGNRIAMLFPAELRQTNTAARVEGRLAALASALGLTAPDLETLRQNHGVSIYRFRTTHLAQTEPGRIPFETFRGDRIVPIGEVTDENVRAAAYGLARHLLSRAIEPTPQDRSDAPATMNNRFMLLGDYRPASDDYVPLIAPPFEMALVAFALADFVALPNLDGELASEVNRVVHWILDDLGDRDDDAFDAATAAAVVYALEAVERSAAHAERHARDGLRHRAIASLPVPGVGEPWQQSLAGDPHAKAMAIGALCRAVRAGWKENLDRALIREMCDAVWAAVPKHQHVMLLPWMGWAELDLASATGDSVSNAETLRSMRDLLELTRVGGPEQIGQPDLLGGFVLGPPGPSLQSARPAAFLATLLRNTELTDRAEREAWFDRHATTVRFLIQLAVRDSLLWSMRNSERARGGLRNAPWDSELPLAGQAMGLLALSETMRSAPEE